MCRQHDQARLCNKRGSLRMLECCKYNVFVHQPHHKRMTTCMCPWLRPFWLKLGGFLSCSWLLSAAAWNASFLLWEVCSSRPSGTRAAASLSSSKGRCRAPAGPGSLAAFLPRPLRAPPAAPPVTGPPAPRVLTTRSGDLALSCTWPGAQPLAAACPGAKPAPSTTPAGGSATPLRAPPAGNGQGCSRR